MPMMMIMIIWIMHFGGDGNHCREKSKQTFLIPLKVFVFLHFTNKIKYMCTCVCKYRYQVSVNLFRIKYSALSSLYSIHKSQGFLNPQRDPAARRRTWAVNQALSPYVMYTYNSCIKTHTYYPS